MVGKDTIKQHFPSGERTFTQKKGIQAITFPVNSSKQPEFCKSDSLISCKLILALMLQLLHFISYCG